MLQLYCIFHLNIAYSSIEEEQRPEIIRRCYWPLLHLARKYDLPFGIEATGYTLEAIAVVDPALGLSKKYENHREDPLYSSCNEKSRGKPICNRFSSAVTVFLVKARESGLRACNHFS